MWPLVPSVNPFRANTRKAPAMCSSCHCRFLYGSSILGTPANAYPPVDNAETLALGSAACIGTVAARDGCVSVVVVDIAVAEFLLEM